MKNNIIITGLTPNSSYYDNSESNKSISGSLTLEFVSCGDMSDFINEDDRLKQAEFLSAIAKCFSGMLSEKIDLSLKIDINNA